MKEYVAPFKGESGTGVVSFHKPQERLVKYSPLLGAKNLLFYVRIVI